MDTGPDPETGSDSVDAIACDNTFKICLGCNMEGKAWVGGGGHLFLSDAERLRNDKQSRVCDHVRESYQEKLLRQLRQGVKGRRV